MATLDSRYWLTIEIHGYHSTHFTFVLKAVRESLPNEIESNMCRAFNLHVICSCLPLWDTDKSIKPRHAATDGVLISRRGSPRQP